ncbi:MAG: helix-turn-helix domain-containing protein [Alphaproteobacteria bacterium]|nr:helix-turn-helix domain-containing protein [Alphaproteobacteria bacterium]
MSGKPYIPSSIDQHIGKRLQLRRTMMGLSLKDLANVCGVTFQQIQKYENADNRISASRLFELGAAMQTPVSFFFMGLPGNMPDETKATRSMRVSQQTEDDPLAKNESLTVIKLYWQLPDKERELILQMLKSLNGVVESNQ